MRRRVALGLAVAGCTAVVGIGELRAETTTSSARVSAVELAQADAKASKRPKRARVTVVGDSVAVNIAEGLRRFGSTRRTLTVQSLAADGCGIARGDPDDPAAVRNCDRWKKRWSRHLERVDPDVIVVVSAGWDVKRRRLQAEAEPVGIGDPDFDAFMKSEYEQAADMLSSQGAHVVFLTAPCIESATKGEMGVFEPQRTVLLNETIIEPLAQERPEMVSVIDLFAKVCGDDGRPLHKIGSMRGVRPDGIHFSYEASVWLAAWLAPQLEAIAAR